MREGGLGGREDREHADASTAFTRLPAPASRVPPVRVPIASISPSASQASAHPARCSGARPFPLRRAFPQGLGAGDRTGRDREGHGSRRLGISWPCLCRALRKELCLQVPTPVTSPVSPAGRSVCRSALRPAARAGRSRSAFPTTQPLPLCRCHRDNLRGGERFLAVQSLTYLK